MDQPFSAFYQKYIREEKVKYYRQHFKKLVPRSLSQEASPEDKIKQTLHRSHRQKQQRARLMQIKSKIDLSPHLTPEKDLAMRSLGQKSISRLQLDQVKRWMDQQLSFVEHDCQHQAVAELQRIYSSAFYEIIAMMRGSSQEAAAFVNGIWQKLIDLYDQVIYGLQLEKAKLEKGLLAQQNTQQITFHSQYEKLKTDFDIVFKENKELRSQNTLLSNDNVYLSNKVKGLNFHLKESKKKNQQQQNQLQQIFEVNQDPAIKNMQLDFQKRSRRVSCFNEETLTKENMMSVADKTQDTTELFLFSSQQTQTREKPMRHKEVICDLQKDVVECALLDATFQPKRFQPSEQKHNKIIYYSDSLNKNTQTSLVIGRGLQIKVNRRDDYEIELDKDYVSFMKFKENKHKLIKNNFSRTTQTSPQLKNSQEASTVTEILMTCIDELIQKKNKSQIKNQQKVPRKKKRFAQESAISFQTNANPSKRTFRRNKEESEEQAEVNQQSKRQTEIQQSKTSIQQKSEREKTETKSIMQVEISERESIINVEVSNQESIMQQDEANRKSMMQIEVEPQEYQLPVPSQKQKSMGESASIHSYQAISSKSRSVSKLSAVEWKSSGSHLKEDILKERQLFTCQDQETIQNNVLKIKQQWQEEQGEAEQPMSKSVLCSTIALLYKESMKQELGINTFPSLVYYHCVNKYGVQTNIENRFYQIIVNSLLHADSPKVRVFLKLLGADDQRPYSKYALQKYFSSLAFLESRQQNIMDVLRYEEIFIQTVVLLEFVVTSLPEIKLCLPQLKTFLDHHQSQENASDLPIIQLDEAMEFCLDRFEESMHGKGVLLVNRLFNALQQKGKLDTDFLRLFLMFKGGQALSVLDQNCNEYLTYEELVTLQLEHSLCKNEELEDLLQAQNSFKHSTSCLSLLKLLKNWMDYKQQLLRLPSAPSRDMIYKLVTQLDCKLMDVNAQPKHDILLTFALIDQNVLLIQGRPS